MSIYCELYGNTFDNRIMEYLIGFQHSEIAVGDMAKTLKISRPKTYSVIYAYEKKRFLKKTRIIGRTQLYQLNNENPLMKILIRNYNECIQLITKKYLNQEDTSKYISNNPDVGIVSAKHG